MNVFLVMLTAALSGLAAGITALSILNDMPTWLSCISISFAVFTALLTIHNAIMVSLHAARSR